jgi:hypothetical protein
MMDVLKVLKPSIVTPKRFEVHLEDVGVALRDSEERELESE